jgi:thymidylate synthase
VIQIFSREDIVGDHKDVPCTGTMQFMIRGEALHMVTNMRSNDAFLGMPHDIFCFTMIQEIIASDLSIRIGNYKHIVGSLHLYESDLDTAREFLNEGWQSTLSSMPAMPLGNPWPCIELLLVAESTIRLEGADRVGRLDDIEPYWGDLIRLLQIFRLKKDQDADGIKAIRGRMSSDVFHPFIDKVVSQLQ